jgi:hypothetical protein
MALVGLKWDGLLCRFWFGDGSPAIHNFWSVPFLQYWVNKFLAAYLPKAFSECTIFLRILIINFYLFLFLLVDTFLGFAQFASDTCKLHVAAFHFSTGLFQIWEMYRPIGRGELHLQSSKLLANSKDFMLSG